MTSDLVLGAVCGSLQLRGSHMGSLPYVYNDHHVPSTPQTPPLTPWPSHLLYPSAPSQRDHPPRPSTTRIVYPHRASTPPLATASLARARLHQHRRVWEVSRRTRRSSREVRPVKLDGGFGRSAHQPAGSGACPCRTVCVYGVTACTAESSRAFGGNAPVLQGL